MRLLLDTRALIWWFAGSAHLSARARQAIEDEANEVVVSAASAWEIATRHRLGKLPEAVELALDIEERIAGQNFGELSITTADAARAGMLPGPHQDPFDRMLIAQAQAYNFILVSNESLFDHYGIRRLW